MRRLMLVLSLLFLTANAFAQTQAPPSLMNFQGRLSKPDGTPVSDGAYSVRFSLWNAATGGTELWTQTGNPITVHNGVFAILLNVGTGTENSATAATLFDSNLWLEIKVGTDTPLTPRQQVASVAYALKAATVPDGSITAAKLAPGVGGGVSGTAGGDLTGTYPNPSLKTDASLLYKVSGTLISALSGANNSPDQVQLQAPQSVLDSAWQSFMPSQNGSLTALDIYTGTISGSPHSAQLVIYDGEGVNGTELGRITISVTAAPGFQYFTLAVPIAVTAGHTYTWYVGRSSSLTFGYAQQNPYAGGHADIGTTLDYAFRTYMTTGGGARIAVNAALTTTGNVGIGVTAPAFPLAFAASPGDKIALSSNGANNVGFGLLSNQLQIHTDVATSDVVFGFGASAALTETGRIKGDGTLVLTDTQPLAIAFKGNNEAGRDTGIGHPNDGILTFWTNNTERLRVDSGGNVGIGTNAPTSELDVRNGTLSLTNNAAATRAQVGDNSGSDSGYMQIFNSTNKIIAGMVQGANNGGNIFVNDASGNNVINLQGDGSLSVRSIIASGSISASALTVAGEHTGGSYFAAEEPTALSIYGNSSTSAALFVQAGNSDAIMASNNSASATLYTQNLGSGEAAHFNGRMFATAKNFIIDHPLDPENKYLIHGCVESDEMRNIYDGMVTLDDKGEATVQMADWFQALNKDCHYQLTCIGGYAQVYIAEEITGNHFKIAGGRPGLKVSWQVTGVRQDAWAKANPMVVEKDKGADRGKYLQPVAFGLPVSRGGAMAPRPEVKKADLKANAASSGKIAPPPSNAALETENAKLKQQDARIKELEKQLAAVLTTLKDGKTMAVADAARK